MASAKEKRRIRNCCEIIHLNGHHLTFHKSMQSIQTSKYHPTRNYIVSALLSTENTLCGWKCNQRHTVAYVK